jgi:poly(3-hydroxybutyrate) depolymerase
MTISRVAWRGVARRILLVALLLTAGPVTAHAQPQPQPGVRAGFSVRTFKDDAGVHKYTVFVPAGYTPARKWPVILFLHGAGERGTDGQLPSTIGLGPLVRAREANFPFLVVFPQNEDVRGRILTGWNPESTDGRRAIAILDQLEKEFSVDSRRQILAGWSMGAYGAWQMAAAFPERWLSVVTVSGGGDPALAERVKNVPLWAFHGAKDRVVSPETTRKMVEALRAAGGSPRLTESADGDHNVWTQVFDDDRLYAWMLIPKSDPAQLKPVTSRPPLAAGETEHTIPEAPFIPAVDVPRAVYVRLGNEALAALADTVPKVVPRDALVGRLNDITDYTEAEGHGFNVYMSGLSYYAQLARANVKAYHKDRLNVQLGLSNVQVTIGGTSISGDSHSASAGPMSVVIGHQRPVWLSFDVTPVIVERKLRLKLLSTSFTIPNDNWYVTGPAGVSVSGLGLTRDKVSSGLVNGIYGRKGTIEREVAAVVPRLLEQMEQKLDVTRFNKAAVGGLWPLPVYQPRLRLWPQEVSTDEQGISLVLGVTAAAVDPSKPPKQVRSVAPLGPGASGVPRTTKLQVGVAPQLLAPLSELLVEADVARIHMADTPSQGLARLSDREVISEIIPDLKRHGESLQVATELVLAGPINIVNAPPEAGTSTPAGEAPTAAGGDGAAPGIPPAAPRFAFEVPRIKVVVSIKSDPGASTWTPCAEFDLSLRQGARPRLLRPTELTRSVAVEWSDAAEIDVKGRFAERYEANDATLDVAKLRAHFESGWDDYVHGGPPSQLALPDIDLGYTKLRATEVGWNEPNLFAVFGPPGVKLTNSSDRPLVYETKGPYSDWGGPYTLKPGGVHEFPITYPLVLRSRAGAGYQMFTLPVGSHSEYRNPVTGGAPVLYQAREPAEIEKARRQAEEKAKPSSTDEGTKPDAATEAPEKPAA